MLLLVLLGVSASTFPSTGVAADGIVSAAVSSAGERTTACAQNAVSSPALTSAQPTFLIDASSTAYVPLDALDQGGLCRYSRMMNQNDESVWLRLLRRKLLSALAYDKRIQHWNNWRRRRRTMSNTSAPPPARARVGVELRQKLSDQRKEPRSILTARPQKVLHGFKIIQPSERSEGRDEKATESRP